jgi:hypothetical protein
MDSSDLGTFSSSAISTRLDTAYSVPDGMRVKEAHPLLVQLRFDQAPVIRDGRLVGWVRTSHLTGRGIVRSSMIPLDRSPVLAMGSPISDAIAAVADHGLVFLAGRKGIDGFIVASDLDRHGVRSYLYVVLSEIEFQLAGLTRQLLSEERVLETFGADQRHAYEEARLKGRETDAVEYLYLRNYLSLIKYMPEVAAFLGKGIRAQRRTLGSLNDLRNCIAHPSRSLTGSFAPEDIATRALMAENVIDELRGHREAAT